MAGSDLPLTLPLNGSRAPPSPGGRRESSALSLGRGWRIAPGEGELFRRQPRVVVNPCRKVGKGTFGQLELAVTPARALPFRQVIGVQRRKQAEIGIHRLECIGIGT